MRAGPVDLIGGFYSDESRHWSVQDTVNWLPVVAEMQGTRTPAKLATPPGLRPYQRIGTGPIRGMHDCEGQRFIVSGRTLYRVTNAGVGIPLGTVPGVGRVSFAHNQHNGGSQVLVTNGAPGGGYVYDTRAQTFERISDEGFPGSLQAAYVDSYLLGVEPFGRFWFHSNLADATDYNTLDRYEAEAAPDRIVGLAVSQFEVIVFGERTAEFWGNTGAATGTFQSKRVVIDRGCASRHTICNLDNSPFWLGDDGVVYRLDGYAARRVSTAPLERAIAGLRWADAFAFAWEDRAHKVYYLTFPDGQTWGFDAVSGLWHRRASYGMDRWRLAHLVNWGGRWYGGDMRDGSLWLLDWDYPGEGDQPMVSERTSPVMADNQSAFTVPRLELLVGVGAAPVELAGAFPGQPVGPQVSGDAPDVGRDDPYGPFTYEVTQGTAAISSVMLHAGALPAGLQMDAQGVITGTPTEEGVFEYTVRVVDQNGFWDEVVDSITVYPYPPEIIDGFRSVSWDMPCKGDYSSSSCYVDDPPDDSFTLTGDGSRTYTVHLAISGSVETRVYIDGDVQDFPAFVKGGRPDSATLSGFNVYSLHISNPPATYYLNHQPGGSVRLELDEAPLTVDIASDATVTLHAESMDGRQIKPSQWMRADVVIGEPHV